MPRLKPGKPAKFSLNGLFLPDLALVYQLDGQSVSGMASVAGLTSTLKTLASIGQVPEVAAGGWDHTETISRRFTRALVKFDDLGGSPAQVELMSQMRAA